jgi:tetratricopeptide (TPR) repeat protein
MREILATVPDENPVERVRVLLSLADVYDLQERFAEARRIYATILEADPKNVVGLNNLAILHSYAEGRAERERGAGLIDQAIEIVGPLPTLLDSRAIVKLNLDQLDSAVDDLRQALDQDSSPTYWLHLAYVQLRKNDLRGASESFERATVSPVDPARMHPLERPFFDELRRRLAPPGT